jgi:hypothetical protein
MFHTYAIPFLMSVIHSFCWASLDAIIYNVLDSSTLYTTYIIIMANHNDYHCIMQVKNAFKLLVQVRQNCTVRTTDV